MYSLKFKPLWSLSGSNGFGSLPLNPESRLNCGIIPLWKSKTTHQLRKPHVETNNLNHSLCIKNWFILAVLIAFTEQPGYVFAFGFRRTLLWEIIDDEECWLSLFFSLLCVIRAFFQSMYSYTPLWNCPQPCHSRRNSFLRCWNYIVLHLMLTWD